MSAVPSHTKRITKNHFMLRGNEKLHIKTETLVHFKPLTKNKRSNSRSILPTFHNDRKYYTCAFQLPSEIEENDQEMLEDHQKRIQESSQEITEMYLPKPRSKNKYCGVCRAHYEDYKEHVQSQNHLNFLRKSPYQMLIHRFCSRLPQLLEKKQPEEQKVVEQSTSQQNSDKCPYPCEFPTPSKCLP